jgi:hypothetical protein
MGQLFSEAQVLTSSASAPYLTFHQLQMHAVPIAY